MPDADVPAVPYHRLGQDLRDAVDRWGDATLTRPGWIAMYSHPAGYYSKEHAERMFTGLRRAGAIDREPTAPGGHRAYRCVARSDAFTLERIARLNASVTRCRKLCAALEVMPADECDVFPSARLLDWWSLANATSRESRSLNEPTDIPGALRSALWEILEPRGYVLDTAEEDRSAAVVRLRPARPDNAEDQP